VIYYLYHYAIPYNNAPIRERTILAFGGLAGLHTGEAFYLRWENVNLKDGTIAMSCSYGWYGFSEHETETSKTITPIIHELLTILKELRLKSPSS
jgi:integrase